MRSIHATAPGASLLKTPTYREEATRRRLTVICALLALALASGLIGSLARPEIHPTSGSTTGPFSYFPSQ
jgi:hypothetical protein